MPLTVTTPPVIKVIQVNLNHCWAAQQLLDQTLVERNSDVALISDYYRPMSDANRWTASADGKCAILICGNSITMIAEKGAGIGYAWVRTSNSLMYSCYCSPNCTLDEFDDFLGGLESSIRNQALNTDIVIVAGDFNSHSAEWGSTTNDVRGELLASFASSLNLEVCNVGSTPTFRRVNAESVIDVTFARPPLGNGSRVTNWIVLDNLYSASDHEYVEFHVSSVAPRSPSAGIPQLARISGWSVKKLSVQALQRNWERDQPPEILPGSATVQADYLHGMLTEACDAAMPRRAAFPGKKAVHWWSTEIASLRQSTIAARRRYQRAGRRSDVSGRETEFIEYNRLRKELRLTIRRAQESSWKTLCDSVDQDPWGVPYRLVTKRLGRKPPAMEARQAATIARALFPETPLTDWASIAMTVTEPTELLDVSCMDPSIPLFSFDELHQALRKIPNNRAPGPDNIPNEIIKLMAGKFPDPFLTVFNSCLKEGLFPVRWKSARLVLIFKGQGKPPDIPSSYRPISLLDGAGKLLERLLLRRLEDHIDHVGTLSHCQFGFRRRMSTIDAISEVIQIARDAGKGPVQNRELCAVVTLDVRNAFNTAPWSIIDAALRKASVPPYLVKIIRSYMCDRSLEVGQDTCLPVRCGVPQGSVLGPTLWNVFYNSVLKLVVPDGTRLIAFADDLAVVATAHTTELLEDLVNPVLALIDDWMTKNGLSLAPNKSESVLLTKRRSIRDPEFYISGTLVPVKRSIRYLGVHLDTRLSFVEHTTLAAAGAKKAATALGRLMPNVGGPSKSKRSLLMSVVHSRLLYGAQLWAESAQNVQKSRNAILQAQRCAALRVARCYRTVSDMAALVLARMPPASLMAIERKTAYEVKKAGTAYSTAEGRLKTILAWQSQWEHTNKAEWTRRLLPDIRRWLTACTVPTYHLSQALSGHGCFRKYLYAKKRADSPYCVYCRTAEDDAAHTLFECPQWDSVRLPVGQFCGGRNPTPEDVQDLVCGATLPADMDSRRRAELEQASVRATNAFLEMVHTIITTKENDERLLQAQARGASNHGG